jgi:hypothetical protein
MHVGCSLIAGLGVMRTWREAWKRMERPSMALGYPYLVVAVAIHGTYNAFALALEAAKVRL